MTAYVNFRVNCKQALGYYEKHLGAKVGMVMMPGSASSSSGSEEESSHLVSTREIQKRNNYV